MALDQTSASRYLVPLGALAALAVAIGVWLVPSSVLDPNPPDVGEVRTTIPEPPKIERQKLPERKEWFALGGGLESLREPDATRVAEDPVPTPTGDPGDETRPAPKVTPRVTVAWEYEGFVEQPDRTAALIRVMGMQRFVFVGDLVTDSSLPPGITAFVSEVTPDHIVVTIDGGEQTIERSDDAQPVRSPLAPGRSRRTIPGQRKS